MTPIYVLQFAHNKLRSSLATPQVNRVPPKTPRIGARNTLSINITAEDANGEVGFAPAHQSRDVQEPMGGAPWPVVLTVMRSGTSQEATVFWNITSTSSSFLASDVGAMEGQVVFLSGEKSYILTQYGVGRVVRRGDRGFGSVSPSPTFWQLGPYL